MVHPWCCPKPQHNNKKQPPVVHRWACATHIVFYLKKSKITPVANMPCTFGSCYNSHNDDGVVLTVWLVLAAVLFFGVCFAAACAQPDTAGIDTIELAYVTQGETHTGVPLLQHPC